MLAVVVPTVALTTVGLGVVADRHGEVREADAVRSQVRVIDQLIALRGALFAERVAVEVLVPARRPSDEVLATTELGRLILDDSAPLAHATDEALARLDPEDRPFDQAELDRVRAGQEGWGRSPDSIRERLEPLTTRTEALMARYATEVRTAAVDLGDSDLIAAGTTFQRSIRMPDAAGEVVAVVSDLWAAPPEGRLPLQSEVATRVGLFTASAERFEESITDPDSPAASFWAGPMQIPPRLQGLLDEVLSGDLSDPARPPGEPASVGATLLEAIDWTIEAETLPLLAADEMIAIAADVADEARAAERTTATLVLLVIALSVTGAVLFGRSIVTPVRRLTGHARRVGSGELALDPLPLDGPPDVSAASGALNDVVGTLRLLERKSRALADIDLDHPSLGEPLPGELGAALQRSTEVLSTSIVEREDLRSRLQHDATHDSLTGLANRAALLTALAGLGGPGGDRDAAVIRVELDGFKQVRNRLGHGAGNVVLQVTAARVAEMAPPGSTVARLGGDEFVVLLTGAAAARDAARRAAAVVDAVAAPIELGGQVLAVRACAGVATADEGSSPLPGPSDLLQRADLAVHDAKLAGPGSVVSYDGALGRRAAEQDDVERALVAALRPGADELRVAFQPIVATATGGLVGLEALVRWDRDGRRVLPDRFVPIAERSGLIVQLDLWVLHAVARQAAAWADVPVLADVPVSVNVSGRTLLQPSFAAEVSAALGEYGVEAERLTLEVTETALVTDLAFAADQLEQVRDVGVRIAIDDFGTGFTSIAQLRALPVDELKIDGSFVRRLPDTSDRVLIQVITDLAELLRLTTVAEGVETAMQAEVLSAIGCNALQGYHFAEPLEAGAVAGWAEDRRWSGGPSAAAGR